MRAHVTAGETFERQDVTPAQARERFVSEGQDYKVELIDDLLSAAPADHPLQSVSLYTNGPFTDLCRGPHAPSTRSIGAFELQSVAGAYWRGDSTRTMLTRIYGTAFHSDAELAEHLRAPGAGPRARPSQARARARPVRLLRGLARRRVLAARRHAPVESTRRGLARDGDRARLHRGQDPAHLRRRAVEDLWALGQVPREHVPRRRRPRARRWARSSR